MTSPGLPRVPSGRSADRIAVGTAFLACLVILIALLGWPLDLPALRGFGFPAQPLRPWTGLSLTMMAVAAGASVLEQRRVARLLLVPPMAIALLGLFEYTTGRAIAFPFFSLPSSPDPTGRLTSGLPSVTTSSMLILLGAAVLFSADGGKRPRRIAIWLASGALAIATASLFTLFIGAPLGVEAMRYFVQSVPAASATVLIAICLLAWRSEEGWSTTSLGDRRLVRRLRLLVPLALILPALASLAGLWLADAGMVPVQEAQILVTGVNIVLIATVIAFAVGRVARTQTTLEELTAALDTAAIVITDMDGTVLHWSRGCETMLGWTAVEVVGRRDQPFDSGALGEWQDMRTAPTDSLIAVERYVERKDGTRAEILALGRRIDRPGKAPIIVYSTTDVTERNRMSAELVRSQEVAAQAVESHRIGIFNWDVASRRMEWSPGSEQRLGLTPGTLTTIDGWRALLDEEDTAKLTATMNEAAAVRHERFTFKCRLHVPDGDIRTMEGATRCFYDREGQLVRGLGVVFDATEQEERALALQASRDQLQSIINTVPDALVVIDEKNIVRQFSSAAEAMFGYAAADVIGRNAVMLMPDAMAGAHSSHLARYLQTGEKRVIGRVRTMTARRADGEEFPMELRVGEAQVGGERLFTGFLRDITEKLSSEQRIANLRNDLAHISRLNEMGDMAANMAHELNQPLAATVNFLGAAGILIKQGRGIDQIGELVDMARQQSLRTGEIIRRLREFIARREVDMRDEPLRETIEDSIALVTVGMGLVEIGLTTNFASDADRMFADRIQVQQVIVNLLRNAFEAVKPLPREQREIQISTRLAGPEMVEISVSDTGPGIPSELEDKLGTPFTSTKSEGMGIGLSICRRIVEAHGGTLRAENRPGGGATFRFTIPYYLAKEEQPL